LVEHRAAALGPWIDHPFPPGCCWSLIGLGEETLPVAAGIMSRRVIGIAIYGTQSDHHWSGWRVSVGL
jgi:hypothetical protein